MRKSARSSRYLYPVNMVIDAEEHSPELALSFNPNKLPNDFQASVDYVLSTLPSEQALALRFFYGGLGDNPCGIGVVAASKAIATSVVRTELLIVSGLRSLVLQDNWNMLTLGISSYISVLKGERSISDGTESHKHLSEIPIEDMLLPVHEYHILQRAGYVTVADVTDADPRDIRKLRNCGRNAYSIIVEALQKYNIDVSRWQEWVNHKE